MCILLHSSGVSLTSRSVLTHLVPVRQHPASCPRPHTPRGPNAPPQRREEVTLKDLHGQDGPGVLQVGDVQVARGVAGQADVEHPEGDRRLINVHGCWTRRNKPKHEALSKVNPCLHCLSTPLCTQTQFSLGSFKCDPLAPLGSLQSPDHRLKLRTNLSEASAAGSKGMKELLIPPKQSTQHGFIVMNMWNHNREHCELQHRAFQMEGCSHSSFCGWTCSSLPWTKAHMEHRARHTLQWFICSLSSWLSFYLSRGNLLSTYRLNKQYWQPFTLRSRFLTPRIFSALQTSHRAFRDKMSNKFSLFYENHLAHCWRFGI